MLGISIKQPFNAVSTALLHHKTALWLLTRHSCMHLLRFMTPCLRTAQNTVQAGRMLPVWYLSLGFSHSTQQLAANVLASTALAMILVPL